MLRRKRKVSRQTKAILGLMTVMCLVFSVSTYVSASSYENDKEFKKSLPDTCGNTTLKSATKTTKRSYGKIQVSTYNHCNGISCWFRTKVKGTYHYWTPYIVDVTDRKAHKVKYCDKDAAYYAKGVSANMRAENVDNVIPITYTPSVSGTIWFN